MTIHRARQLLGTDGENLTDQEVRDLISRTRALCASLLDIVTRDIVAGKPAPIIHHEQHRDYLR